MTRKGSGVRLPHRPQSRRAALGRRPRTRVRAPSRTPWTPARSCPPDRGSTPGACRGTFLRVRGWNRAERPVRTGRPADGGRNPARLSRAGSGRPGPDRHGRAVRPRRWGTSESAPARRGAPVALVVGFKTACWLDPDAAAAPKLGRLVHRDSVTVDERGRVVLTAECGGTWRSPPPLRSRWSPTPSRRSPRQRAAGRRRPWTARRSP